MAMISAFFALALATVPLAHAGTLLLAPSTGSANPVTCGDLLATVSRKPAHLVFKGCRLEADRQGKPMTATYRVARRYAAHVEAQLIRTAGLVRLRRSCCAWNAPPGQFVDGKKRNYRIAIASGETPIAARRNWARIREFEVTVELFTEEI
jgi:Domian of unknown function (DUF4952)